MNLTYVELDDLAYINLVVDPMSATQKQNSHDAANQSFKLKFILKYMYENKKI